MKKEIIEFYCDACKKRLKGKDLHNYLHSYPKYTIRYGINGSYEHNLMLCKDCYLKVKKCLTKFKFDFPTDHEEIEDIKENNNNE